MLILFFDNKSVIDVPKSQTVNAMFYVQVLDCLCKRIVHVKPEMWRDWKFFLLHDNARPHTAAVFGQTRSSTVESPPHIRQI